MKKNRQQPEKQLLASIVIKHFVSLMFTLLKLNFSINPYAANACTVHVPYTNVRSIYSITAVLVVISI